METYTTPNTVASIESILEGHMMAPMSNIGQMQREMAGHAHGLSSSQSSHLGGQFSDQQSRESPFQFHSNLARPPIASGSVDVSLNREAETWVQQPSIATISQETSAQASDEEDDEDPLDPGAILAPWDNMLSLAEAARLQADGHIVRPGPGGRGRVVLSFESDKPAKGKSSKAKAKKRRLPFEYHGGLPHRGIDMPGDVGMDEAGKRRRLESMVEVMHAESQASGGVAGLAGASEAGRIATLPNPGKAHSFPDIVDLGYCTEQEGRELFDL